MVTLLQIALVSTALQAAPIEVPAASSTAVPATSVTAPASDEATRVINYYYNGQAGGPLLIDLKACFQVDVGEESPTKHECSNVISSPVRKGALVHAWMLWMVPDKSEYDDVSVQYVRAGEVKTSIAITLKTALRSRVFRAMALNQPGAWEIRVVRGGKTLKSVNVTVEP